MYKIILFFVCSFPIFQVFFNPSNIEKISLNKTEINHDLLNHQSPKTIKTPYLASYEKEQKELKFIASKHQAGLKSPTFQLIKKTMESFKPEIVIIEGIPTSLGKNPSLLKEAATKASQENFKNSVEILYAVYLSSEMNIPFIGGEPSDKMVYQNLIDLGYTDQDYLGFYLVRVIPQWQKENMLSSGFDKKAQHQLNKDAEKLNLPSLSLEEFYTWYLKVQKEKFNVTSINTDTTMPLKSGTFLQNLAWNNTAQRNNQLLEVIEDSLNKHNKVLVIYGASHHNALQNALEKHFGSAKFSN